MAKGSPFIKIDGFDDFIKQIKQAGGNVDTLVTQCVEQSADIIEKELKAKMQKANVSNDLINQIPNPSIFVSKNIVNAKVGYKTGKYNPKALTDGYKAMFINYGTPRIKPRDFIKKAKSSASSKVKKLQLETFNNILEGLKK